MKTLKAKYKAQDDSIMHPCVILCHVKNEYYQFKDELAHVQAKPISDIMSVISPLHVQTAMALVTAPFSGFHHASMTSPSKPMIFLM